MPEAVAQLLADAGVRLPRGAAILLDGATPNTAIQSETTAAVSFTDSAVSDLIVKEPNAQRILLGTHGTSAAQAATAVVDNAKVNMIEAQVGSKSLPRGRVALGSITANTSDIGTTETLAGPTTSFTYNPARRYKVSFVGILGSSASTTTQVICNLRANLGAAVTVASAQIQGSQKNLNGTNPESVSFFTEVAPATYAAGTLNLATSLKTATNTAHISAGTGFASQILVEDIGT